MATCGLRRCLLLVDRAHILAHPSFSWQMSSSPETPTLKSSSLLASAFPSDLSGDMVSSVQCGCESSTVTNGLEASALTHSSKQLFSDRAIESTSDGIGSTQQLQPQEPLLGVSHCLPVLEAIHEDYSKDWQDFGRSSEMPPLVRKLMHEVKALESELGEKLVFGGPRGSLQGRAKAAEEHRHRTFYGHIPDGEEKLQFFTSRQVACRILGSKGYLCEHCWLPIPDCMCNKIIKMPLWPGAQLWLYMHPKDYLRKNNSGKLLWQVFGEKAARLCIYGLKEHEDTMWNALTQAGQGSCWYLYPERSLVDYHVDEISIPKDLVQQIESTENFKPVLNFVLIDGTWNNSKALVSRLQDRAKVTWEAKCIQSVCLSPERLSVLHGLRPQPSLEQTCTADAAAQLLRELDLRKELVGCHLGNAADAIDDALQHLLDSLATRRQRNGRATTRAKIH